MEVAVDQTVMIKIKTSDRRPSVWFPTERLLIFLQMDFENDEVRFGVQKRESPPCGGMFALPQLADIVVVTIEVMTWRGPSRTFRDRSPGPLGHVTLRGDRATAPLQHICNFRFRGFLC